MRLFELATTLTPWALPGMLVVGLLAIPLAPIAGRALFAPAFLAYLLVVSTGWVLIATLTPGGHGGLPESWREPNLTLSLPSWETLTTINETSLNVLLFAPLGLAIALLPRIRAATVLFGLAVLAPAGIEVAQYLIPELGRVGLQMDDVVANEIGLFAGAVLGLVIRLILRGLVAMGGQADGSDDGSRGTATASKPEMRQSHEGRQPVVGVAR